MKLQIATAVALVALALGGAAQAANFVTNPGFEASPNGPTSLAFSGDGGPSAAPGWPLYNNSFALTSSAVVTSTAPDGESQMLRISTGGSFNGLYQVLSGFARYASVSVNVRSGTVGLFLYSDAGTVQRGHAYSVAGPGWQTLALDTGAVNSDEIVIYSFGGGAEFDVDNAYASDFLAPVSSGAPEPAAWALLVGGFAIAGGAVRRRRWATA